MIRLGMLQFRIQAIIAAVVTAAFAVLLAATGPHLASIYAADGLDSCHGISCLNMATYFSGSLTQGPYGVLFLLSTGIILLAPAVIGLFWGAPLIARELETGTADLAWNQSVTRTRWLAVKLAIGGLTAMALTEALCLMQTWWAAPISQAVADGAGSGVAQSRFSQLNFASHGITPLGYAAFAFALGVTAGALI
ncbi:MAG: ABC transporter permease, partial [Trebonia sp.]